MAQPIKRSAISATAETAESGIGGGLLGGLAGIVGGGLLGAVVVAAATIAVVTAIGGFGGLAVGLIPYGMTPAQGIVAGMAALKPLAVGLAWAGGAVGGVGGAYYGGIAGGVIGAAKGAMGKAGRINADEKMAANVGKDKQLEQMQQMAAIREQAADQYTRMGYAQGIQDGQAAVVQQLQQAALAQQQAEQNKPSFVDKLAKERGVDAEQLASANHAEHAKHSKEAANHAAHIG
jgi:hypothetical protein